MVDYTAQLLKIAEHRNLIAIFYTHKSVLKCIINYLETAMINNPNV